MLSYNLYFYLIFRQGLFEYVQGHAGLENENSSSGSYNFEEKRGVCVITMDDVIKAFKCKEAEERIPVLRLELDYELAMLYEAMKEQDELKKNRSLKRLYQLRQELLLLEEF